MIGRKVDVRIDGKWFAGCIAEVERSKQSRHLLVRMLPHPDMVMPADVILSPDSENTLWRWQGIEWAENTADALVEKDAS